MFDLSAPMKGCVMNQGRYLFLEGDLKYKDNTSKVKNWLCYLEIVIEPRLTNINSSHQANPMTSV